MLSIEELIDLWREAGYRLTPQRLAIFNGLFGHETHPTADDIYQSLIDEYPSLSRNTVYTTLDRLSKLREIQELFIERNVSHFDPDIMPHAHASCRSCGKLDDLELNLSSPAAEQVRNPVGFKVEKFQILLSGLCRECRDREQNQGQEDAPGS